MSESTVLHIAERMREEAEVRAAIAPAGGYEYLLLNQMSFLDLAKIAIEAMQPPPAPPKQYRVYTGYHPKDSSDAVMVASITGYREVAERMAADLLAENPNCLPAVTNERGSLVWTPDWRAEDEDANP